jgi:radical SAM PhpK family P-methyltransferase
MEKIIDCLFIGHYEMDFAEYEGAIRKMGVKSGAYRDLSLNFIRYNNRPYPISEIFNVFFYQDRDADESDRKFQVSESFSAAIAYLGTYLHRRGHTFDYVNSFQDSKTQLAEKLAKGNILTVAIVTTLYVSALPIIEIIEFTRKYNQTAKIIVGGPFVSTKVRTLSTEELEYTFKSTIGADIYVNSSQGETTLVNIITALKNNLPLDHIPNILVNTGNSLTTTPIKKENNKLAENMVNWELFAGGPGDYVNVRTAISCPFACSFCGFPEHAGPYQPTDIPAIETELKGLDALETVKSVHFIDDTFNVPVERFKNLLQMMIENKFAFKWHSYFRCQFADREMVELMKMSGCEGVFLGIESGSDRILKNMNKAADIQKYLKGIQLLKEYGIVTYGNFIIGFPGETEETVQETIRFIETSGLDFFRAQLWYCEPITPIWKLRDRYRIQGESFQWSHATMDADKACDLVEKVFLTVKESTWVPQYNFDFDNIWHLTHRGMAMTQLDQFLRSFNNAVKEKLTRSFHQEVSFAALEQIKNACSGSPVEPAVHYHPGASASINTAEADFEFL